MRKSEVRNRRSEIGGIVFFLIAVLCPLTSLFAQATYVPRAIKELDDARGVSLSLKFTPIWDGTKFTPRFILQSDVTDLVSDLSGKVPTSRTVNGHPLSANVTVAYSELAGPFPTLPISLGPVTNEFLTSYNSATGNFTKGPGAEGVVDGQQLFDDTHVLSLDAGTRQLADEDGTPTAQWDLGSFRAYGLEAVSPNELGALQDSAYISIFPGNLEVVNSDSVTVVKLQNHQGVLYGAYFAPDLTLATSGIVGIDDLRNNWNEGNKNIDLFNRKLYAEDGTTIIFDYSTSLTEARTSLGLGIGMDVQAYDPDLTTWAGITPGTGVGTFLTTPSSANLAAALTDETGTGAAVFGTSPIVTTSLTINEGVGSSALTLTGATQTTSKPIINTTQTWNAGGVAFKGLVLNTVQTARSTSSELIALQSSGVDQWYVDYRGHSVGEGASAGEFNLYTTTAKAMASQGGNASVTGRIMQFGANVGNGIEGFAMASGTRMVWTSVASGASNDGGNGGNADTGFARNAAGVAEVNNGTAGTLRDITLRNATASGTLAVTGASTLTGGVTNSLAGAASTSAEILTGTWLTGGTGTTNFPHLLLQATGTTASTAWSTAGTAIGANAVTGFTGNLIDLQVAGTSKFKVSSAGSLTLGSSISTGGGMTVAGAVTLTSGYLVVPAAGQYYFTGRSTIFSPADGRLLLQNDANNNFDRLQFGGTTSSFPALKRSTTSLAVRLADDSGDAPVSASNLTLSGSLIGGVQALSGAGAVNLTTVSTAVTTTAAANALTLANGTNGQIKTVVHVVKGTLGTAILTPTTANGFTSVTFTNAGDSVMLQYFSSNGWVVIGSHGVTIT